MAKPPKPDKLELAHALQSLRDEIRSEVEQLSQFVERLQTVPTEPADNGELRQQINEVLKSLREDVRTESAYLSELISKKTAELQVSVPPVTADAGPDVTEAIDTVREEVRRGMNSLAQSVSTQTRRSRSPILMVLGLVASLLVGMLGASLYYEQLDEPAPVPVAVGPQIEAALAPQATTLASHTQTLTAHGETLQAIAAKLDQDADVPIAELDGPSLAELFDEVVSLRTSLDNQGRRLETALQMNQELADEVASLVTQASDRVTVARPALPDEEEAPEEAQTSDRVVAQSIEAGRVLIKNPSGFDLKLLVNDKPIDVKAGGTTTVSVTVGKVKTQIANFPALTQYWDEWQRVGGESQLTISVATDGNQYWLR